MQKTRKKSFVYKFSLVLLILGLCFTQFLFITPTKQAIASSLPAVFLLPHQDDDMFLSGAIKQHLLAGRDVHVVIVTDGAATGARLRLNGLDDSSKPFLDNIAPISTHQPTLIGYDASGKPLYRHFPTKEGYHILSKQEITASRNLETLSALAKLGVARDHIHFANDDLNANKIPGESSVTGWAFPKFKDGAMTKELANQVLSYYFSKFGAGSYKTIAVGTGAPLSDYVHLDHLAIYQSLRDFKGVTDKRFYGALESTSGVAKAYLPTDILSLKASSLNEYYYWSPSQNRYAIGEHSVKGLLDTYKKRNYETVYADKTAPANVTSALAVYGPGKVVLSWKNPTNSDFYGVRVVRKLGSAPTTINDGVSVYIGAGTTFTNSGLINNRVYYYRIFSYDTVYNYSNGVVVKAFSHY